MGELIAFRALQGVGAGGLLPLSQAAIADLFSPRERGRYQGYIGAMWATAAVAGPLLGGTLTDAASLALDLLHQPPAGGVRARGRDAHDAPRRPHARAPIDWRGRGRAERRRDRRAAGLRVGRDDLRVGLARGDRRGRDRACSASWPSSASSSAARRSRCSRSTLFRGRTFAVSTAAALAIGARAVRDHDLRAGLHAGRARRVGDELRRRADPAHVRLGGRRASSPAS